MQVAHRESSRSALDALLESATPPCVSLYLRIRGQAVGERAVVVRQLLAQARRVLASYGVSAKEVDELLAPFSEQVDDPAFWSGKHEGFAAFIDAGRTQFLQLPLAVPNFLSVSNDFHLLPIAELFEPERQFFVLIVDKERAELFLADRWEIETVSSTPVVLNEGAPQDSQQATLQLRRAGTGPTSTTHFHGHGGQKDAAKIDIERHLRSIARSLEPHIAQKSLPLVVGGDRSLTAQLVPMLGRTHVIGQFNGRLAQAPAEDMHAAAWAVAENGLYPDLQDSIERYQSLAGTGFAIDDRAELATAAATSNVAVLFLPEAVDASKDQAVDHERLNTLLVGTLRSHGVVYVARNSHSSEIARLPAAILRRPPTPGA